LTKLRSRLTYANVVATLSLFLVLAGGTAFAASQLGKNTVGSKQLKKNAVTTAKIKNGAVTGAKVKISSLGTVPSATNAETARNATHAASADTAKNAVHADSAATAEKATSAATADRATSAVTAVNANSATTAATATNALSLGGIPASGYTRSDCASISGQVKGFALVNGAAVSHSGFSTAGVGLPYNCSGGAVEVEGRGGGAYLVTFVGSPVVLAVASSTDTEGAGPLRAGTVSVRAYAPGKFEVETYDSKANGYYEGSFSIITP
jgi:hypothetical protein